MHCIRILRIDEWSMSHAQGFSAELPPGIVFNNLEALTIYGQFLGVELDPRCIPPASLLSRAPALKRLTMCHYVSDGTDQACWPLCSNLETLRLHMIHALHSKDILSIGTYCKKLKLVTFSRYRRGFFYPVLPKPKDILKGLLPLRRQLQSLTLFISGNRDYERHCYKIQRTEGNALGSGTVSKMSRRACSSSTSERRETYTMAFRIPFKQTGALFDGPGLGAGFITHFHQCQKRKSTHTSECPSQDVQGLPGCIPP
ncbi:hypothetical protein QBC35DRAFT_556031 [Podospora australis]|uniref:F-box domain-containing protein n=1 Tax=Podospora australis TaxID=1536484 RepID=A0AAN6WQG8_9PEZI|nr:hypothetical protein QBC35DRAFT_556031 [Podospora australis]